MTASLFLTYYAYGRPASRTILVHSVVIYKVLPVVHSSAIDDCVSHDCSDDDQSD